MPTGLLMGTTRPRFVTAPDSAVNPRSQLEAGLAHALALVGEAGGGGGLLLTFSAKMNLETASPRLAKRLGPRLVGSLWSTRGTDGPIRVMVDRDSAPLSWTGPALMVWPSAKMLNVVGEIVGVTAEIVVPWTANAEGITTWINTWSPVPIGAAAKTAAPPPLPPVVTVALRSLTTFVNLGNGLATKSDREEAIRVFETLLAFEPDLDIAAVRGWLVSEGRWPGEVADKAHVILEELRGGSPLRGRRGPDKALYEWWRQRAHAEGTPGSE